MKRCHDEEPGCRRTPGPSAAFCMTENDLSRLWFYGASSVSPAAFASAHASCSASAWCSGVLVPLRISWKPSNITELKFAGVRTSML